MSHKKKKPRKAINVPLRNFTNALRSSKKPVSVISNHRKFVSPSDYPEFFDIIQQNYLSSFLTANFFLPKETRYVHAFPPFKEISLFNELRWALVRIQKEIDNIKEFVNYSSDYNRYIIKENYEEGLELLNKIDTQICKSVWTTSKIQALLQKVGGLDSNKAYTNKLLEEENPTGIFSFLISAISSRNEDTVDINWMQTHFFSAIDNGDIDTSLKEYLYYILHRPISDVYNYSALIRVSGTSSLIDLYECFIFVLSKLIYEPTFSNKNILFLVNKIINDVDDFRLKKIAYLLSFDNKYIEEFDRLDSSYFDLTRNTKPCEIKELDQNKNVLGAIHLEINASKYLIDHNLEPKNPNILNYWKVLKKEDDFYSYYHSIIKNSIDAAPTGNEFVVTNFLKTELSSDPFCESNALDHLEFIYSDYIAPTHILCLPDKLAKKEFLSFLLRNYKKSPVCDYFSEMLDVSNTKIIQEMTMI